MEAEREYIRLNSGTVSQSVKYVYISPNLGLQSTDLSEDFHIYAYHKCMTTHQILLSALLEIAGVSCQGVFVEDNLSM